MSSALCYNEFRGGPFAKAMIQGRPASLRERAKGPPENSFGFFFFCFVVNFVTQGALTQQVLAYNYDVSSQPRFVFRFHTLAGKAYALGEHKGLYFSVSHSRE